MSRESWASEHYPIPAEQAVGSELEALQHSHKKWIGARAENYTRHGARLYERNLIFKDGRSFGFTSDTCALCLRHGFTCNSNGPCSLIEILGDICCHDNPQLSESPYDRFVRTGNPEPMIQLIEDAIKMISKDR
jgi:hypothetical protein